MFTLKNISGSEVEVRHLSMGGKFVKHNETLDVTEKIHDEIDDAYITVKTVPNIVGRDDNGDIVYEDEEVYTAWPKAHWEKVTKSKKDDNESKKDEENK